MGERGRGRSAPPNWDLCRRVVREHGKTFYFASQFLPLERRRAIHAAYAFCRIADDIVDRAPATGLAVAARDLDAWEAELDAPLHPVAVAFAAARAEYAIPDQAARDLMAGVRMDLAPEPYATWDDLRLYCYRVAGTVGLISAPILGCVDGARLANAVDLGIAMQLTNILRDVGEDARMGRLYLPLADLAAFDVNPAATLAGRPSGRFCGLMQFEIARARSYYDSAREGIPALLPAGQLTTLASAHLYAKILNRIEENGYEVFQTRAVIPNSRKLRAMPTVAAAFVRLQMPDGVWFRT
ncbi:MAG: squalene/phytoene synthase family protein [Chloroflexia bacterium]|nr:squalene/phytoene synthase family protein [Chloroflexia bacterium]